MNSPGTAETKISSGPESFISLGAGTLARDDLVFLPLLQLHSNENSSSSSLLHPPNHPHPSGSCSLARRAFWRVSSSYSIELRRANFIPFILAELSEHRRRIRFCSIVENRSFAPCNFRLFLYRFPFLTRVLTQRENVSFVQRRWQIVCDLKTQEITFSPFVLTLYSSQRNLETLDVRQIRPLYSILKQYSIYDVTDATQLRYIQLYITNNY